MEAYRIGKSGCWFCRKPTSDDTRDGFVKLAVVGGGDLLVETHGECLDRAKATYDPRLLISEADADAIVNDLNA